MKSRSTFAVLFILNRSKMKKNGLCPILGRISIDAKAVQFSTKLDVAPSDWSAKLGRTINSREINNRLDSFVQEIAVYYNEILESKGYVTAELVKNALCGIGRKETMLLALFDEHNEEFDKRVGVDRVAVTAESYHRTRKHLAAFIKQKYDVEDVSLKSLDFEFIDKFDLFMRIERGYSNNFILGQIISLRKIIRRAISQGTLHKDPFYLYEARPTLAKRRHLTMEEIERVMAVTIESPRVCFARDMFVFAMFTGLSYVDLKSLSTQYIYQDSDNKWWIKINRQKTGSECVIQLLNIPLRIIDKYRDERKTDKIFNMPSLTDICRKLREIEKLAGVKHINFHMSRHNFAVNCINNDVPIETISRMMGHCSISTTQIYSKISNNKVNRDMKSLAAKITDRFTVYEDVEMPVGIRLN